MVVSHEVTNTGNQQALVAKFWAVSDANGFDDLYFKFTGSSGLLLHFEWWEFNQ
jgi:hypothetical protein